jgi:predicted nucleotidyltransferase
LPYKIIIHISGGKCNQNKGEFMNFCAIISEFNPFHNGHEHIIKSAKEICGLPVMCIMSGDFVQRGQPSTLDKFVRAKCAIDAGADMVLELPTIFALSSAQNFAYGAIKILKELGCSHLAIGATYTEYKDYLQLAKIKNSNLKTAMQTELDKGQNYSQTLINVLKAEHPSAQKIFCDASNILALEYICQIMEQKADISVILIPRTDGGYNATKASGKFASASIIRALASSGNMDDAKKYVPSYATCQFDQLVDQERIDTVALYNLRNTEPETLENYYDYTEGLPYLLSKCARANNSVLSTAASAACKRYRLARLKKLCYYPSLNLTKTAAQKISNGKIVTRLLAIRRSQKAFISKFNKKGVRVIVSAGDYNRLTKSQKLCADIDMRASNLYSLGAGKKYNSDITTGTLFID